MTSPQRIDNLNHALRERIAYIDFRLYFFGEIGRPDLIQRFGVAPAGATRDLGLYREIAPQNISFDGSNKIYRIGKTFAPLFEHATQRVLSALALGFGDGVNVDSQPLLPCESPSALNNPRMDVLAPICRAIHAKRPIAVRYHSMSSGESERVIVPFALVDINQRVEALYDRDHCIGHAYFTSLAQVPDGDERLVALSQVFSNRIVPLLEEYFFEDWQKIRLVLADNQKPEAARFVIESQDHEEDLARLFGSDHGLDTYATKQRYVVQDASFTNPDAYIGIYQALPA